MATLELPRSVILALWLQAGGSRRAASVVVGDDEPHEVAGGRYADLDDLIDDIGERTWDVAAVLPAPGDPLVGPPDAPAAGECVLVHSNDDGWDLAIVPEVHRFGSRLEPGASVVWRTHEVDDWRTTFQAAVGSLDDTERGLREGLMLATQALVQLDVAQWRPDAADRITAVRDGSLPGDRLTDEFKAWPQRVRVMQQAARLRAIVELATEDEGGAVNLWQSDQRSTALREVDRLARRAMSAASAWLGGDAVRAHGTVVRRQREEDRHRDERP
ncbi:MAG: hypothetical protein BGO37_03265 [Cellulomonas sp. 73-92]|uniref:hypothetical protein n=1 Tax=Cellulomonas sp. 73-92 TaxID=1895740 RepID=UPI00092AF2D8|nr:hypothetical protein [Cellulomonas sp. 73-92]OJV80394.1 MAG: hypothetical protein BGO37_03265 [Cellulomonas sp. 73-92]